METEDKGGEGQKRSRGVSVNGRERRGIGPRPPSEILNGSRETLGAIYK